MNTSVGESNMREAIRKSVSHAAHRLPAQAPIARFVHHNTLHAYESQPFEEALNRAAGELNAQTYLDEFAYGAAVRTGRILPEDIDAALAESACDPRPIAEGLPERTSWRRARLLAPVPALRGEAVDWWLSESDALESPRPEVEDAARARIDAQALACGGTMPWLQQLWEASASSAHAASPRLRAPMVRLRDRILAATGLDVDELVHPLLIRFVAAYLDQGVAYWPMPERVGLWPTFCRYQQHAPNPPWLQGLERILADGHDAESQVVAELTVRGVAPDDVDGFVHATLQALPGWAGMVHQFETRPDLTPGIAPPTSLMDFVALRLVLDRLAAQHIADDVGLDLRTMRRPFPYERETHDAPNVALELFVMAQRFALAPSTVARQAKALVEEICAFDAQARRRVYHLAYERHYRVQVLDALAVQARQRIADPEAPLAQIVFCIDEREESYRRHLEEIEPRVATYAYAGHFDVLMRFEGHGAPFPVPLCPPIVTPRHRVREVPQGGDGLDRRQALGRAHHTRRIASRTLVRGSVMSIGGLVSALPLVAHTLFPRLAERLTHASRHALAPAVPTRFELTRPESVGPDEDGLFDGYTHAEQAAVVESVLRGIGLTRDFAPLVVVLGHGSTSVNNPHASAYNCGACAGGKGGANARAYALMANHPEVRRRLAERGIAIPDTTTFAGACHDTTTDAIEWYDVEALTTEARAALERLLPTLDRAGERDAHERCRRFPDAPLDLTPRQALEHAIGRGADLAQPRPEYCHATNACCIVARRSLTRGLYLDRRAFLVSYDPTTDDAESHLLERLLAQVGPVGAGINLEYYFSRVDQQRFGCGTKLPHNITGLIGVMDGHASDLRTGLHWQTVELHEPMRLLVVAEAPPAALERIAGRHEVLRRLIANRWVLLASVDPSTGEVWFLERDGFRRHDSGERSVPVARDSISHYRGMRDHRPTARIASVTGEVAP